MILGSFSVVIVNWNSGALLGRCLASLVENGGSRLDRIIVVDNGSTDSSLEFSINSEKIEVHRGVINDGFARACNRGAAEVNSEFILFLNPDAAVWPGTPDAVLDFLGRPENQRVGICGVQLIDECGDISRSCARFPTAKSFCFSSLGLSRIFPNKGMLMVDWAHDQTAEVDHVIGAFYFVRASVFRGLGGFDDRFFLYLEDLDFTLRAKMSGWRSVYLASARAFHAGGGTSRQVKAHRLFYSLRSRIIYAFKNFDTCPAFAVLVAVMLFEPIVRFGWGVGRLSGSTLLETARAYGMLLRWVPQWVLRGSTR